MADNIVIDLVIVEPIILDFTTAPVYSIGTAQAGPTGPQGINGIGQILTGDKSSALDAGTFKQMSLGDDYLYICTQTGTVGNAVWKKTPLFKAT